MGRAQMQVSLAHRWSATERQRALLDWAQHAIDGLERSRARADQPRGRSHAQRGPPADAESRGESGCAAGYESRHQSRAVPGSRDRASTNAGLDPRVAMHLQLARNATSVSPCGRRQGSALPAAHSKNCRRRPRDTPATRDAGLADRICDSRQSERVPADYGYPNQGVRSRSDSLNHGEGREALASHGR